MKNELLTQEYLKQILHYNPDSGEFFWIKNTPIENWKRAGTKNPLRYVQILIQGKIYLAHRLAFIYMKGENPIEQIDHINHNKIDNRWCNLRLVSHQENHRNMPIQLNNKSGHNGIYWHKSANKWCSMIKVNGKNKYLGLFKNIKQAIQARKDAELYYNFHKNHGITI